MVVQVARNVGAYHLVMGGSNLTASQDDGDIRFGELLEKVYRNRDGGNVLVAYHCEHESRCLAATASPAVAHTLRSTIRC